MTIQRVALLSVHTSPLAPFGGKKTGGMNVYVRELAYELGVRGVDVDIFVRRTSSDEPPVDSRIHPRVRVVYLEAGGVRPLAPDELFPHLSEFTARLMAFAAREGLRYDIVYAHYWLSGWVGQKLKEAWGVPFVQMFHTLGQMKQRIDAADNPFTLHERVNTEMAIVDWADAIIAATPAEQAQLLWLYRAKRRKIVIVPPGVNVERFFPQDKASARACLGFDACHLLLFVGRIEPLKGLDTILEALKVLKQTHPELIQNLCFAVVGGQLGAGDTELERVQALAETLGVAHVVRFIGAKDQSELPYYYAASTAVIMASDYESFGMVALEAMASGTPVIATQVGGLAFLVRDNETGYHVPVRDPVQLAHRIHDLLSDPKKQREMGENASYLAQDYAWSRVADRLLDLFAVLKARYPRRA